MQSYKTSRFGLVGAGEVLLLVLGSRRHCWTSDGLVRREANRPDITESQNGPLEQVWDFRLAWSCDHVFHNAPHGFFETKV